MKILYNISAGISGLPTPLLQVPPEFQEISDKLQAEQSGIPQMAIESQQIETKRATMTVGGYMAQSFATEWMRMMILN